MKKSISVKMLLFAAGLTLFAGCMSRQPAYVGTQVTTADNINVGQPTQPPPENRTEVIPACPGPRTLWYFIDGHWEWRGEWQWIPGHWRTRPHPGDIWLRGKWVEQTNETTHTSVYVWQKGHWRSGAPADEESSDR